LTNPHIRNYTRYIYTQGDTPIPANSQFAIAIHALTLLAQSSDEPMTSELIAGSVNTNPVFMRRVMGSLSRVGRVASQPGVGGGWRLVRALELIALQERANKNTQAQTELERRNREDNRREAALQAYIDKMAELLLVNGLLESKPGDEVCTIARMWTVAVVQGLERPFRNILYADGQS
jgi:predicted transcriptional regulator